MVFYKVLVASKNFRGNEALTYHSDQSFKPGSVVAVPLRNSRAVGIVVGSSPKPSFATKPINGQVTDRLLPAASLKLLDWLRSYYPAPLGIITQLFVPSSLLISPRSNQLPDSPKAPLHRLPPLTNEQQDVLKHVKQTGTYLLQGATGSGKTRVYIELAKRALAKDRSALILTPEIGLTSQLANHFKMVFGQQVLVVHSALTPAERRRLWLRILNADDPLIIIGPRSALFYPLKALGLLVVDESHESAYKQEQAPHYQAARVAAKLAELHQAPLILGSATPSVEDFFIAHTKQVPILAMTRPARADADHKADIQVIDLRNRDHFSTHPFLSNELLAALEKTKSRGEQSLLFLNRRGTARLVICQDCGWHSVCPHCDLPLTYHGDEHVLRCHVCGFSEPSPSACPICGSTDILFKAMGTKALSAELKRLFPSYRIQRFDTDNKKAERFEQHYDNVRAGKVDVLVGTQLLTKGLDLPKLSLVGVVTADASLNFPDFTAEERTYQMLHQVIGRVSRGHLSGQAIIQTYAPDNPTIAAAVKRDWPGFYEMQIKERQLFGFPPFRYLLRLFSSRSSREAAKKAALDYKKQLEQSGHQVEIVGPSPAFYEKQAGKYQWQLVIKAKRRQELLDIIQLLPSNWNYDIDPANLL